MKNTTKCLLLAIASGLLIAAVLWYHDHEALEASRSWVLTGELLPMATLLKENGVLLQELKSEPFAEKDSGILESYLAKVRRDGLTKHADMKQKLDALAENNTAIITLIKAYAPQAKTPAFSTESDKFRNYSSAWRDRWNSVMELFMAGGNYAASEVLLPPRFSESVQFEIVAAR